MSITVFPQVTVLGAGVLGAQIAFQTAHSGRDVVVYDIDASAVAHGQSRLDALVAVYAELPESSREQAEASRARIRVTDDLAVAVAQAGLVIEAIPEVLELKRETFAKLNTLTGPETVFATNSSTLLPSAMADATGRPEQFAALHFANRIWLHNTAEIMGTPQTSQQTIEALSAFACEIAMVPILVTKEKAGYILNSMLVPLVNSAMGLLAGGYGSVEDIDATWKIGTGAPMGPLEMLDVIGLNTPYHILLAGGPQEQRLAAWLKTEYLDAGRTFYSHPGE